MSSIPRAERIALRKAMRPNFASAVASGHLHRLRLLRDEKGNLIGRGCTVKGCRQVFTASGQLSKPEERSANGLHTRATKSHAKRVKAMRSKKKVRK